MANKDSQNKNSVALTIKDFHEVIDEIRKKFHALSADELFVLWFLRAFVTDSEEKAAESVAGGTNDKGIDAILIDDSMRCVFVVQAKYRKTLGEITEKRADVLNIVETARKISDPNQSTFDKSLKSTDALVAKQLQAARDRIMKRKYKLWLYYVTLGKVSREIDEAAQSDAQKVPCNVGIEIIDSKRVTILLRDYLDGVAPPIPALDLEMEANPEVRVNGTAQRYDEKNRVESWVFSMRGNAVAELYNFAGIRLFARNVRGFLGHNTPINQGMIDTLKNEPDRFFYYNNGVTILCDEAHKQSRNGKDILHVRNPQVINGQQTTRTLASHAELAAKASVLVKVIRVDSREGETTAFDSLLSRIVAGTNWQNAIKVSDLMSNDRVQINLERSMRQLGYAYIRKRQTKSDIKSMVGNKKIRCVYKEEIAQIAAACEIDPVIARAAKDKLFEEQLYERVFSTSEPYFYLTRYHLMREVLYCSRGDQARREARFLVLNYVWSRIASKLLSSTYARDFVEKCEKQIDEIVIPLNQALNHVFDAASGFFKANRGTGSDAVDDATFYKSKRADSKKFRLYVDTVAKQKLAIERSMKKTISNIGQ